MGNEMLGLSGVLLLYYDILGIFLYKMKNLC